MIRGELDRAKSITRITKQHSPLTWLACAGLLALFATSAAASNPLLPRTEAEFSIDGVLDDAGWQEATRIPIAWETDPAENIPARVKTVAYLVEDGESLYVAFDAEDPDPDAIRAHLRDRDSAWNDDWVGLVIDTYGDERRAFEFLINPLGVQMDLTFDDVNRNEDSSWDAIWDSAGRIDDRGYVVEIEIPLSQLRFPYVEGSQRWGIDLIRSYPRERRYRFSNNRTDRNVSCYLCRFDKIEGLEGVEPSLDLEIVPTLTALRVETTDDPGVVPIESEDPDVEAGVSVRWGITPDLTANLTINPDFSQVEADVAQLDVNEQFALFFPEKRPFFLEGADYFRTPLGRSVFTRTVADPIVGAKLTGKRGDNTFGMFAAQDEVTNLIFPSAFGSDSTSLDIDNTVLVGRYSRGFGEASSVGTLVTSRNGDGYHNHLGGFDVNLLLDDRHRVQAQYLWTDTEYPLDVADEFEQPRGSFDGTAAELSYEYDSRNWRFYAEHAERSRGFRADAGFYPQVDINRQEVGLDRTWYGEDGSFLSKVRLGGNWDINHDDDGRLLEREVEGFLSMDGPLQSLFRIGALTRDRLFDDVLFKEKNISLNTEIQPRGGLKLGAWFRAGKQIDFANTRLGDEVRLEPFLLWNVNRNLFLRYEGSFVRLDTEDGAKIFDASVHDVRLTWQFNVRSYIRLTAQLRDIVRNQDVHEDDVDARSESVGRQLLYSYKLNPQTVFFVGYSDQQIDDDALSDLTPTDRTWFMKIGYAWTP